MDQDFDHLDDEHEEVVTSVSEADRGKGMTETNMNGFSSAPSNTESEYASGDDSSISESQGFRSPLKRPAEDTTVHRPFKRQRGELNYSYLDLLNKDIEDAAHRASFSDLDDLLSSQIGLTHWSPSEKHKCFEAVARLGKQDLRGISTIIGSKSTAEVSHYLNFLLEAQKLRRSVATTRPVLEPAEYPAAVEISQQCCHAQEEAADEISLKQEVREEEREQHKWGSIWDVTPKIAKRLARDARDAADSQLPGFVQTFHLPKWLEISRRMFMNSSVQGNNWNFIEDEPPSIWATTFEDFHSLAVSFTRRLVQTTIFMAMSRIRSKSATGSKIRDMVQLQDAEAAILSLGIRSNRDELWIRSARRLRLEVYEEPPEDDEDHEDPMTYDEVEQALSGQHISELPIRLAESETAQFAYSDDESSSIEHFSDSSRSPSPIGEEAKAIKEEADEVFAYSALGIRTDKPAREALKARIAMDREKERQAGEFDEYASHKAELEMWTVLQRKPPMELPKKQEPGPPKRSNLDVEGLYPGGREWVRKLQFYSEWETMPEPEGGGI